MQFDILKLILITIFFNNLLFSQNYDIKNDSLNASGWFGGDDRPGQQRNVAIAQSVFIDEPITLKSFAFYFTSPFDSVNGSLSGHEVMLKLHIRDSLGIILQINSIVVPDTFTSGWINWSDINLNISESGQYIFSTYLVEGFDSNQVHSGIGSDLNAGYPDGEMFVKYVVNETEAESWGDWSMHSWDSNFWLSGSIISTSVERMEGDIHTFELSQNYPNPFNSNTTISYYVSQPEKINLTIFNTLGQNVRELVNEVKPQGEYSIIWDGLNNSGQSVTSDKYFYRLKIGESILKTQKMILLK